MHHQSRVELLLGSILFVVLFSAAVLPVAVGWRASEASFDETRCYLPAITQMRANFPAVDILRDSLSASPPGYTHLLAALSFIGGDSLPVHRAWHFAISLLGAIGLLWFVAFLVRDNALVVAALLPAVCSGYYLKCAAQLTTDNLAFALSFAVTALAIFGGSSRRNAAFAGMIGIVATYVRHVTAWTAVPILARAIVLWCRKSVRDRGSCWRVAAWMGSAAVVVLTLGAFVWSWHGLVPPLWVRAHGAVSLTPLVYCLSLFGLFAPIFLGVAALSRALKLSWQDVLWGSFLGLALFFLSETAPSYEAGRWGGPLWTLAGKMPLWGGRSFLFLPAAMLGGACLATAIRSLVARVPGQAFIWAATFVAWMVTGIPNRQVFHRYFEGPILAFLGLWLIAVSHSWRGSNVSGRAILYTLSGALFVSGVYSMLTSATGFAVPILDR